MCRNVGRGASLDQSGSTIYNPRDFCFHVTANVLKNIIYLFFIVFTCAYWPMQQCLGGERKDTKYNSLSRYFIFRWPLRLRCCVLIEGRLWSWRKRFLCSATAAAAGVLSWWSVRVMQPARWGGLRTVCCTLQQLQHCKEAVCPGWGLFWAPQSTDIVPWFSVNRSQAFFAV